SCPGARRRGRRPWSWSTWPPSAARGGPGRSSWRSRPEALLVERANDVGGRGLAVLGDELLDGVELGHLRLLLGGVLRLLGELLLVPAEEGGISRHELLEALDDRLPSEVVAADRPAHASVGRSHRVPLLVDLGEVDVVDDGEA